MKYNLKPITTKHLVASFFTCDCTEIDEDDIVTESTIFCCCFKALGTFTEMEQIYLKCKERKSCAMPTPKRKPRIAKDETESTECTMVFSTSEHSLGSFPKRDRQRINEKMMRRAPRTNVDSLMYPVDETQSDKRSGLSTVSEVSEIPKVGRYGSGEKTSKKRGIPGHLPFSEASGSDKSKKKRKSKSGVDPKLTLKKAGSSDGLKTAAKSEKTGFDDGPKTVGKYSKSVISDQKTAKSEKSEIEDRPKTAGKYSKFVVSEKTAAEVYSEMGSEVSKGISSGSHSRSLVDSKSKYSKSEAVAYAKAGSTVFSKSGKVEHKDLAMGKYTRFAAISETDAHENQREKAVERGKIAEKPVEVEKNVDKTARDETFP